MTTMEDWDFITIPFGKTHKGEAFPKLPISYLQWLRDNVSDPFLRTAAGMYLQGLPPPELEACVFLTLSRSEVLIEIEAPFDLKEDIKDLTERQWMDTRKRWCSPLHMMEEIMQAFPQAHVSDDLKKATQGKTDRQMTLQELNDVTGSGEIGFGKGLKLYKYQDICTRFLDATGGCCLIADDPGLGKTIESLAWLRMHQKYRPILIVCPAVMKGTWKLEIEKWIPGTKITTIKDKKPYIYSPGGGATIINYELMDAWQTVLGGHHYDTLIVDESHYIKNSRALRSKAVEEVSVDIPHRILMSGTPVVNSPKDLWNQLHIIDPVTYQYFLGFGKRYCLLPEAPILMSDFTEKPMKDIRIGDKVIGWSKRVGRRGSSINDAKQLLCETTVTDVMEFESPVQKVVMSNGDVVFCTPDHKWYTGYTPDFEYARVWKTANDVIKPGRLIQIPYRINPVYSMHDKEYMLGYILGAFMGDGWCTHTTGTSKYNLFKDTSTLSERKRSEDTWNVGCACGDPEPIDRIKEFLSDLQIKFNYRIRGDGLYQIDIANPGTAGYAFIESMLQNANWDDPVFCAGYLGGMYDTDGSYNVICQVKDVNPLTYSLIERCLKLHCIAYSLHYDCITILNGRMGMTNFWCISNPSLKRKIQAYFSYRNGHIQQCKVPISHIEPVDGTHRVLGMTTGTGNYVAHGYASKNCGGHQEIFNGKESWVFDDATNLEELSTLLKTSIMIRRTKEMVLPDLPDKTRIVNPIELENWDAYHNLEELCRKPPGTWTDRAPITQFTELLMAVMRGKITPAIRYISEQLNTIDKLVVFGVHKEMLDAIVEKFEDKVGVVRIDGSTPTTKRTGLVEMFQTDPEIRLFVGNVKAAGVGITLTAASHVTFVEYPWTSVELTQAEDRLHRITQKNAVTVNVLAAEHTMDAIMADKIVNKRFTINTINNDMTWDHLRELIGE